MLTLSLTGTTASIWMCKHKDFFVGTENDTVSQTSIIFVANVPTHGSQTNT